MAYSQGSAAIRNSPTPSSHCGITSLFTLQQLGKFGQRLATKQHRIYPRSNGRNAGVFEAALWPTGQIIQHALTDLQLWRNRLRNLQDIAILQTWLESFHATLVDDFYHLFSLHLQILYTQTSYIVNKVQVGFLPAVASI
jgi:hypothetical protein